MSSNPFQSPAADLHTEPESVVLPQIYSAKQVGLATYLGSSPVAGGLLLWLNFREKPSERPMVAVITVLVMVGWTLFAFFGPDASAPARAINLAMGWGYYSWAKKQPMNDELRAVQREQHSWWRVLGLSLLCLFIYMALMVPMVMIFDPDMAGELMELMREL